jgi:hypothetical protein
VVHARYWSEVAGAWWDTWGRRWRRFDAFEELTSMVALDRALQQMQLDRSLLTTRAPSTDRVAYVRAQTQRELGRSRAALRAIARAHVRGCARRGDKLPDELAKAIAEWRL